LGHNIIQLYKKHLKLKNIYLCFLILFAYPVELYAAPPIKIHTILLKERLSTTQKLGYNRVLDFILQDTQNNFEHTFAPLPRQSSAFENDIKSCLFPVNEWAWKAHGNRDEFELISSEPIDIVSARIYTLKSAPLITNTNQLNQKNIGHLIGNLGVKLLNKQKGITFSPVNNGESMIKMITRGRIDAILGFHPDTLISMHRLDFSQLHYSKKLALFEVPIHMVCHKNPQAQAFIKTINLRIKEAHNKKLFQSMLGNEAQIAPLKKRHNTN